MPLYLSVLLLLGILYIEQRIESNAANSQIRLAIVLRKLSLICGSPPTLWSKSGHPVPCNANSQDEEEKKKGPLPSIARAERYLRPIPTLFPCLGLVEARFQTWVGERE